LSPRELRVIQLAAEGRTNREIAYQLYVTLKTIEGHLARAYTKLGIERRHELSKFFEGEKPGCLPLAKDCPRRDPSARIQQAEGGSNGNDCA
jgi:DNA-binding CsgD family transcriptional regulator